MSQEILNKQSSEERRKEPRCVVPAIYHKYITMEANGSNACLIDFSKNGIGFVTLQELKVGALVDSVQEVLEITDESTLPPPNIGSKYKSEFIYGMAKKEEGFIMLLDMDKVFSADEILDLKGQADETEAAEVINDPKEKELETT